MKKEKYIPSLRPIPKYDGYFISDRGEVFSFRDASKPVRLKEINHSLDYDVVNLIDEEGKTNTWLLHRLVMLVWGEEMPNDNNYVIIHKDGNKKNNVIDNLEWIKRSELSCTKAEAVKAAGIDEGDVIRFRTSTDAAKYFHTNQPIIKKHILNNKVYKGYRFSLLK